MNNLGPEILAQMRTAMRRPEGSAAFVYTSQEAFAVQEVKGLVFQVTSGSHLFRIERALPRVLHFYHASPGTGTRVASLDLAAVSEFDTALLAFTWTPQEIAFYCGPHLPDTELLQAKGVPAEQRFQVGSDGSVYQIGDTSLQVMGVNVFKGGQPVLKPTGIEAWEETRKAVEILRSGKSDQGFIHETVVSASILVMLVTGFETYAKQRLTEIEAEGVSPDSRSLFDAFSSAAKSASGIYEEMEQKASSSSQSILTQFVDSRAINFQNYNHVKKAYRQAYGIKISELGIAPDVLGTLRRYIRYRHKIVHISPLMSIMNQSELAREDPDFANFALAESAQSCFDEVITKLHAATLSLRPDD